MLAPVSAMRALTTGRHAAPGADTKASAILGNVAKLLGFLLGLEQQLPWAAGSLRLELANLVCGEWKASMHLWVSEQPLLASGRHLPAGAAGSHVCVMGEPSPWCIPVHAATPFARPVRQA